MSFPRTMNTVSANAFQEWLRGVNNHTKLEAAEGGYDLAGYLSYLSFGTSQPIPAAAQAVPAHITNEEAADAVKALCETHQQAPRPGTQSALGDGVPPWLKAFILSVLVKLLTGG